MRGMLEKPKRTGFEIPVAVAIAVVFRADGCNGEHSPRSGKPTAGNRTTSERSRLPPFPHHGVVDALDPMFLVFLVRVPFSACHTPPPRTKDRRSYDK